MSQPLIAAHRGASEFLPEHSLAAYRQAIVEGADGFEFDLRLTADGHLVLHHDRTVKRTSDGRGAIADMTLAQLRELNFAARHPDCRSDPEAARIPTIEDVLGLVADSGRDIRLYIEAKHPSKFGPRLEMRLWETLRRWPGLQATVMSFSRAALKTWRRLDNTTPLVWIFEYPFRRPPEGVQALSSKVDHVESTPTFFERAHEQGYEAYVWTVNDAETAQRLAEAGADVLFTDRPAAIRKALTDSPR
ncbi:glycerophosphodiester phosphodiesterase [Glycomyces xiaoerkulensis]|uniref:glycerophosphodiester phosphodiesterase n=1 Tax=Glycomyces xiaoerkulensis TaxID=2038139 RepID=UPI0012FFF543|nr:glycerophosphodiester phosphodiesterase family protein [Glycomyces xiaoerkulensis]